jgi:hypothetical protein
LSLRTTRAVDEAKRTAAQATNGIADRDRAYAVAFIGQ